jgi:uncharacterized protein involved in exopolysaccharide biosynthesis
MDNETITKNSGQEDEISLLDLFAVLWRWKWMIIAITVLAAISVAIYSIISIKMPPAKSYRPDVYTARALMLIDDRTSSANTASLNNLASSIAGVRVPVTATNSRLAIYLVGTNSLLDSVVDHFNLFERYKNHKSPKTASRRRIRGRLRATVDEKSNVFAVSFTDKDPVFARDVVNYCVSYLQNRFDELGLDKKNIEKENLELNIATTLQDIQELEEEIISLEQSAVSFSGRLRDITRDISHINMELNAKRQIYSQLRVQYELLKVNIASETHLFQVLELAEIPDRKSGPNRGKLCIIVTAAAGFGSVFLAFVLNAILNIIKDPEAMAKLRRTNDKK